MAMLVPRERHAYFPGITLANGLLGVQILTTAIVHGVRPRSIVMAHT